MTNMTMTIGIDPGKKGGIAILYPNGDVVAEKWTSEDEMVDVLEDVMRFDPAAQITAYLELVHAMPGQGVTSMFSFGKNFGFWIGAVMALRIPLRTVRPQDWQKGVAGRQGLKGTPLKRVLKAEAARRFPQVRVTNMTADALLIADYGRGQP